MKSKDKVWFGLIIIAVGLIWFAVTLMLAPCIQLPSSCPPQSAATNPILIIFGLYVYVLGFFLSIPLTMSGVILMVWEKKKQTIQRIMLIVAVAVLIVFIAWLVLLFSSQPTAIVSSTTTVSTTTISCPPWCATSSITTLPTTTSNSPTTAIIILSPSSTINSFTSTNIISLRDVGLCASICIYPSPYVSATIFVNASVPLSTLHLFINGTDEGITTTANTMTHYALLFKAGPNNPAMPIVDGKTYTITLAATFQDNCTCTVSATVVAGSGSGITTTNT